MITLRHTKTQKFTCRPLTKNPKASTPSRKKTLPTATTSTTTQKLAHLRRATPVQALLHSRHSFSGRRHTITQPNYVWIRPLPPNLKNQTLTMHKKRLVVSNRFPKKFWVTSMTPLLCFKRRSRRHLQRRSLLFLRKHSTQPNFLTKKKLCWIIPTHQAAKTTNDLCLSMMILRNWTKQSTKFWVEWCPTTISRQVSMLLTALLTIGPPSMWLPSSSPIRIFSNEPNCWRRQKRPMFQFSE